MQAVDRENAELLARAHNGNNIISGTVFQDNSLTEIAQQIERTHNVHGIHINTGLSSTYQWDVSEENPPSNEEEMETEDDPDAQPFDIQEENNGS